MKFTVLVDPSLVIIIIYFVYLFYSHHYYTLRVRAFASHAGDRGSIPGRDKPKSLKQVVTAPLPNAWQPVWVSRVLGDDHDYKRLARVAVGVARSKTLATQWPWLPSIGQICNSSPAIVTSPYEPYRNTPISCKKYYVKSKDNHLWISIHVVGHLLKCMNELTLNDRYEFLK